MIFRVMHFAPPLPLVVEYSRPVATRPCCATGGTWWIAAVLRAVDHVTRPAACRRGARCRALVALTFPALDADPDLLLVECIFASLRPCSAAGKTRRISAAVRAVHHVTRPVFCRWDARGGAIPAWILLAV
jgi:hypothetical protein